MATVMKSGGLHHAASLGNIQSSSQSNHIHSSYRSYDSEDENMGRKKTRPTGTGLYPKPSIYSRGDIREQYCLSDKQLSTIERPRREGFFGCWSGRGVPQSFLGVCVGRRAPSDENVADVFYKYPRSAGPTPKHNPVDDDIESSYFRRRPTSFLSSGDPKRYTWMPADDESVRLEGPRSIRPDNPEDPNRGPYVVGSYPPRTYLSQSSEHLPTGYRCPAHVSISAMTQPSTNGPETITTTVPRIKHVSFARSHTLTSFDEATVVRSVSRINSAKSQERLIGGKKPSITSAHTHQLSSHHQHHQPQQTYPQILLPLVVTAAATGPSTATVQQHQHQHQQQQQQQQTLSSTQELAMLEKLKRHAMKTQATQTEVCLARKQLLANSHSSLSPRTIHRIQKSSQGAQTNGILAGRKLTKSLSEAMGGRKVNINGEIVIPDDDLNHICEHQHEPLHRTQSEEPPRSPFESTDQHFKSPFHTHFDMQSRTSSRQSELETSRSDLHSEHLLSHSRHLSQDSAASYRSMDVTTSKDSVSMLFGHHEHMVPSRVSSRETSADFLDNGSGHGSFESNSLPRRKCAYHAGEYHTNSLPRNDRLHQYRNQYYQQSESLESSTFRDDVSSINDFLSRENSADSNQHAQDVTKRRFSCGVQELLSANNHIFSHATPNGNAMLFRRNSENNFYHMQHHHHLHMLPTDNNDEDGEEDEENDDDEESDSDEYCSTCESENESVHETEQPEKEIFIDFKPRMSPTPNLRIHKKRLQKTLSDGEILLDKRRDVVDTGGDGDDDACLHAAISASEEDLKNKQREKKYSYLYSNVPIKDEGICDKKNLLHLPGGDHDHTNVHNRREAFRKRSISLEENAADDDACKTDRSGPTSPCPEDRLSCKSNTEFPSSDSLANDLARDHSDGGIWNESQATVLLVEPTASEAATTLITPTTKRKNLLLQHQQRSSMDTEALEMEDHFNDQFVPQSVLTSGGKSNVSKVGAPANQTAGASNKTAATMVGPLPSIAVIPSRSMDTDDYENPAQRKSRALANALRNEVRRKSHDPSMHIYSNIPNEVAADNQMKKPSEPHILFLQHSDSGKTDVSECSTNTEDYITCNTDLSKRGIKPPSASSSSTTQMPVHTQSSQTITQDGSSFESASSMYSLARVDAICEEGPMAEDTLQLPAGPSTKPSPSHSVSSSSSGSYCMAGMKKQPVKTSPSRTNVVKPISVTKTKMGSVSDDEKSEKRYSSSGYYESPHDDEPSRPRRNRDWNEEERRRRKEKMRLDIEKENMKSLTSPAKKTSPSFKQISGDDRQAMNILDGTSLHKAKRIRAKTRRSPRSRTSNDDTLSRRVRTPIVISSEKADAEAPPAKIVPAGHVIGKTGVATVSATIGGALPTTTTSTTPTSNSPKKRVGPSPEKGLQAISIESLRSVSPGSDSVFYSEADVHCHHCGKEVEIVTALRDSEEAIAINEEERVNIVQPPADFADSPDGPRTSHHTTRLYKKFDKRFRSEERHGERRHYRNRQESVRAKSEERGKDGVRKEPTLRPAGSSPCVVVEGNFNVRDQVADPEQGIYHGFYRLGMWICITDRDVWRRNELVLHEDRVVRDISDRRPSTESEKDFRKKYQAITHRLVHRKSCVEMYRRQTSNSFSQLITKNSANSNESLRTRLEELLKQMLVVWAKEGVALKFVTGEKSDTDKTIIVRRESGEFGFRIHGSKPVVVSAIEPETPAETSGLEVGDIVLAVNGVSVIDKSHSEVVKIAHAGSDVLELEVARTIGLLSTETTEASSPSLYSGYLWRQGGQASGVPNNQHWVRRWFCLRPDHCLYYYKTDTDIQPVGAVLLTNHTVENCSSDVGRAFAFRISSGESPPLYLAADSEEAANRWIAVTSHASKQSDPWLETSTRNLRLPPNGVPRPDCFGYLLKLGNRWRAWSKRYCVLKDACLYFYHDGNSKSAFGMACLQAYRVQPTNNTAGKKHAFEIAPPEPKLRHYYFSTESEMDKKRWVAALEYSIDRWMKAG